MQHHICPTRPSSCTKSLSLKRMCPLACGYACVMRQQWSTEAHRQHCCCNKLKYVGCGCYPHAPKQLLMYAGGWAQQNLLLECMTWLKMCRPCYCSSGACSSIICNQLQRRVCHLLQSPQARQLPPLGKVIRQLPQRLRRRQLGTHWKTCWSPLPAQRLLSLLSQVRLLQQFDNCRKELNIFTFSLRHHLPGSAC